MESKILKEHVTMKSLPMSSQPYEKCDKLGPAALSEEELLSVIFRSGTRNKRVTEVARNVISLCESYGGLGFLERVPVSELTKIDGIGKVKALQLKCIGELSKRVWKSTNATIEMRISSAKDIYDVFANELKGLEVEEVWILYLNSKNAILSKKQLTKGTINSSLISAREIFKDALKVNALSIALVHNHPSGDPEPSLEDLSVTRQLRDAAAVMDINLIDHVIIGDGRYVSLKQKGIL